MSYLIVSCARTWLGTRFHHQGRLKRTATHSGGVDCLGLLVGVAAELSLTAADGSPLAAADEFCYSHSPDTGYLKQKLGGLLCQVGKEQLRPGDVLLLRIEEQPQHLAIVSDMAGGLGMIHAYAPARRVVEHALDVWWRANIEAVFRIN